MIEVTPEASHVLNNFLLSPKDWHLTQGAVPVKDGACFVAVGRAFVGNCNLKGHRTLGRYESTGRRARWCAAAAAGVDLEEVEAEDGSSSRLSRQ